MKLALRNSASLLILSTIAFTTPTFASAQDSSSSFEAEDIVIATGTLIRRQAQEDRSSPVVTLGEADISSTGAKSIADLTQTLTINTGSENNPDAFTQNSTVGTSNINLRGLGVQSTLVLLDGRRQVLSATITNGGYQFVDGTGKSDEFILQGMAGRNFDRGNIMGAISYTERSELTTAEKRLSRAQDDTSALGNPGAFVPLYDLSDTIRMDAQLSYADNSAKRGNSPSFPFLVGGVVPADHPNTIFAGPLAPLAPGGAVFLGRASGNGGVVSPSTTDSETFRFSAGLEGDLNDTTNWRLSYTNAQNDYVVRTEDTLVNEFRCALDGFRSAACSGFGIAAGSFFNPFSSSFNT